MAKTIPILTPLPTPIAEITSPVLKRLPFENSLSHILFIYMSE